MDSILDLNKLIATPVNNDYFPYCQLDGFIKPQWHKEILKDFPKTKIRGSIPVHRLNYGPQFQKLLAELQHESLRNVIAEKFSIDLSTSHAMLTVRAYTNSRDGHIHTDTPSKLMTLLLYFNEDWSEPTGNLRLLKDSTNLDNYFEEVPATMGKLLVFKVTDNCWHGHFPFFGKRQAIQLNYVTEQHIVNKEMRRHSRSYTLKKIKHALLGHL